MGKCSEKCREASSRRLKERSQKLSPGELRAAEWERSVRAHIVGRKAFKSRHQRPVIAFACKGDGVLRYASLAKAAEDCVKRGWSKTVASAKTVISLSCNGHHRSAMGFVWRYDWEAFGLTAKGGFKRVLEWERGIDSILWRRKLMSRLAKKPVIGFELNGDGILRYASAGDAARDMLKRGLVRTFSTASTCIWSCCNRKYHSGLGYVWRYDLERVVLPPRPTVVPGRKGRRGQPVVARKVGGVEELHYGSQTDAARDLVARGISRSVHAATLSINRCCCGSPYNQTAYGYRWSIAPTISINGLFFSCGKKLR